MFCFIASVAAEDRECIVDYLSVEAGHTPVTKSMAADAELLKTQCNAPGDAPICVFRTWQACLIWGEPEWCAVVGLPGLTFEQGGREPLAKPKEPWRADLSNADLRKAYGRVIGTRVIDKQRCKMPSTFDSGIDKYLGHTEIMWVDERYGGEYEDRESLLVKKINNAWQVTGWNSWQQPDLCVFADNEDDPFGKIFCDIYAPIGAWALETERHATQK